MSSAEKYRILYGFEFVARILERLPIEYDYKTQHDDFERGVHEGYVYAAKTDQNGH